MKNHKDIYRRRKARLIAAGTWEKHLERKRKVMAGLRQKWKAMGLTVQGTFPIYKVVDGKRVYLRHGQWKTGFTETVFRKIRRRTLHSRLRRNAWMRKQRESRAELGLTSRGNPRRNNLLGRPANPVEIKYRQFRETVPESPRLLDPLSRYE